MKKNTKKYTFFKSLSQVDIIRIHKSSFEKIKITIKSQENKSSPLKQLLDFRYVRFVNAWRNGNVTSGTETPDKCTDT